jgi:hypothetical protein
MNPGMSMAPNPGVSTTQQNVNPGISNGMNPGMSMAPNPGVSVSQPSVNPGMSNEMNPGMSMAPNPGVSVSQPSVNPGMSNEMNPGMSMAPNPGVSATQQNVNPGISNGMNPGVSGFQSNVDIDADRMQSIEEQLSKTSQYNPEDLLQEKITIPTDNQYEKNKSGLTFVIVLFIVLAVVIAFLPQITKLIK